MSSELCKKCGGLKTVPALGQISIQCDNCKGIGRVEIGGNSTIKDPPFNPNPNNYPVDEFQKIMENPILNEKGIIRAHGMTIRRPEMKDMPAMPVNRPVPKIEKPEISEASKKDHIESEKKVEKNIKQQFDQPMITRENSAGLVSAEALEKDIRSVDEIERKIAEPIPAPHLPNLEERKQQDIEEMRARIEEVIELKKKKKRA